MGIIQFHTDTAAVTNEFCVTCTESSATKHVAYNKKMESHRALNGSHPPVTASCATGENDSCHQNGHWNAPTTKNIDNMQTKNPYLQGGVASSKH